MGFLSNVLGSVLRFIFPRQFREELAEEIKEEKGIWRRKIAKTGISKQGNKNLFAFTFEDNKTDRFRILKQRIEAEFDVELSDDVLGYDDSQTVARPPFIFPKIEVGKE